jgi:hypothetical protein
MILEKWTLVFGSRSPCGSPGVSGAEIPVDSTSK